MRRMGQIFAQNQDLKLDVLLRAASWVRKIWEPKKFPLYFTQNIGLCLFPSVFRRSL